MSARVKQPIWTKIHGGNKMQRERLISVKEAAKLLNISVHTLYSWVSEKRIPSVKMGRRVAFDPEDLEAWVNKNKIAPQGS